jgi:hypothetical protein
VCSSRPCGGSDWRCTWGARPETSHPSAAPAGGWSAATPAVGRRREGRGIGSGLAGRPRQARELVATAPVEVRSSDLLAMIFINYRAHEGSWLARSIYSTLVIRFGHRRVFIDNRSIQPGDDFPEAIAAAVRRCSVMLVLIGHNWSGPQGNGRTRLADQHDWVRWEIAEALRRGVRVIPVLFDGARMPMATELPGDIAGLARRQYFALHHRRGDDDLRYLVRRLDNLLPGFVAHRSRPLPICGKRLPTALKNARVIALAVGFMTAVLVGTTVAGADKFGNAAPATAAPAGRAIPPGPSSSIPAREPREQSAASRNGPRSAAQISRLELPYSRYLDLETTRIDIAAAPRSDVTIPDRMNTIGTRNGSLIVAVDQQPDNCHKQHYNLDHADLVRDTFGRRYCIRTNTRHYFLLIVIEVDAESIRLAVRQV